MAPQTEVASPDRAPTVTPDPKGRPKPSLGVADAWWPIALASEVQQHPKAFRLGSRDLAVYRDLQGVVRAVDDSCPHRRMALSMGRITEDGYLQCGYHGWCFDGATGRCMRIPNLSAHEKVPAGRGVAAFATAENIADVLGWQLRAPWPAPRVGPPTGEEPDESTTMFDAQVMDGFVLVWSGQGEPVGGAAPASRAAAGSGEHGADRPEFAGTAMARVPHARLADAMLLNPGRALGLSALFGGGIEMAKPRVEIGGGAVTVHRRRLTLDLPRVGTFYELSGHETSARITTVADTGLTWVDTLPGSGVASAHVVIALTPIGEYRTQIRWRGHVDGRRSRQLLARLLGIARSRTARPGAAAEGQADRAEGAIDDGLDRLRELRDRQLSNLNERRKEDRQ